MNILSNANIIETAVIIDLELTFATEAPPTLDDHRGYYAVAEIALPGVAVKRYDGMLIFIIQDSNLFDGVDGRRLISAMKVRAQTDA